MGTHCNRETETEIDQKILREGEREREQDERKEEVQTDCDKKNKESEEQVVREKERMKGTN